MDAAFLALILFGFDAGILMAVASILVGVLILLGLAISSKRSNRRW